MKLKSLNITSPRQNASRLALLAAGVCLLIMLFMMPSIDEDNAIYHNGAIVAMNAYFILLVSGFLLRVWPIPPETLVGSKNLKHYHEFLQAHKHTLPEWGDWLPAELNETMTYREYASFRKRVNKALFKAIMFRHKK